MGGPVSGSVQDISTQKHLILGVTRSKPFHAAAITQHSNVPIQMQCPDSPFPSDQGERARDSDGGRNQRPLTPARAQFSSTSVKGAAAHNLFSFRLT